MDRGSERARLDRHHIVSEVERRELPGELAMLPVVESAYQPFAYSPARASGIWQFIPSTGRVYGLRYSWWYDGRRDVVESTRAALDYLEKLHAEFSGDWLLALAAYNSGEGNVRKAIRRNQRAGKPIDFWSLKLPRETRSYVPRLLAVAAIVAQPDNHGLTLKPIHAGGIVSAQSGLQPLGDGPGRPAPAAVAGQCGPGLRDSPRRATRR
jgi:membrane-bound lytic murein transglycosylase D